MRRLVIHVGPSKTASTTLQQFLSTYNATPHNFTYPKWGWTRPDNGHHNLAYQLRNDARYATELGGLNALRADLAEGRQVFLSSEDFPIYTRMLVPVVELCREFSVEPEILFFVRDPIARLNSMYTQQVKTFVETRRFHDFIQMAKKEDKLKLRKQVKAPLEAMGFKVTFAPFIGARMGEIFARVCEHYGYDASPEKFQHTNPAPSPEEIALYRQIGHRMVKSNVSHWEACNIHTRKYGFNRKYFGFDAGLIEEVKSHLAEEYDDMNDLGVMFLQKELEDTFFTIKEKCADIADEDAFQDFKADIIKYMRL